MALRAERKSRETVKSYCDGVRAFLRWCGRVEKTPVLERSLVNEFVAALLDDGLEPSTARSRQLALRRFAAWLTEEDELDHDPLVGLKPPRLDTKVVPSLTDDEIQRLIKACQGKDFRDRRDEAIVRLMVETAMRAGECVAGLDNFHPHVLRHTGASRWLSAGGSEGGLMAIAGWSTRDMIDRYTRSTAASRAAQEARNLNLGDF
ncbi:tyrosine-type recombinase/integrase [Nocardia gipuzkoensis]|uniref:tyrosine-type recombinase/integrase n=1 Tax=Nocardia gipuzkoensis TaxID=2749991 RepID=UPI003EE2F195